MPDSQHLLFIPGTLCDARLFQPQIDFFKQQFSVSVADITQHNSLEAIARSILDSVPQQFSLVGLSMGGIVAMEIMRQAPERVIRLALLNTSYSNEPIEKQQIRLQQMDQVATYGHEGLMRMVEDYYYPFYVAKNNHSNTSIKQTILDMAQDAGVVTFINQWNALLHRPDSTATLKSLTCPTLILCGEEDVLCKPKVHEEMAALISGSRLKIIPDCGHLSTLEKPEVVNTHLLNWLNTNIENQFKKKTDNNEYQKSA